LPPSVLINAKNVKIVDHLSNLYAHLLENHYIDCIVGFDTKHAEHLLAGRAPTDKGEGPNLGGDGADAPWSTPSSGAASSAIRRRPLLEGDK
jgi:hypothetical protein